MLAHLFIAFISLFIYFLFFPDFRTIFTHTCNIMQISIILYSTIYIYIMLYIIFTLIIFIISLYLDLSYISSFSLASQIDVFGVIIIHGLQNIMHSHLETYTDHTHFKQFYSHYYYLYYITFNYTHILIIWYILFFHLCHLVELSFANWRVWRHSCFNPFWTSEYYTLTHKNSYSYSLWLHIHSILYISLYYIIHIHLYSLFTYYIQVHLHNYSISQIYSVNSTSSLLSILCIRSLFDYYIHNLLIYTLLYT